MGRVEGLDKFLKDLERMERDFPKESRKMMNSIGSVAKSKAQANVPVDTGELRLKMQFRTLSESEVVVFNNLNYAAHVEWGHKTRLGTGGKSSSLYNKKGERTKRKIEGVFFLKKAINSTEEQLPELVGAMVKKVLKK